MRYVVPAVAGVFRFYAHSVFDLTRTSAAETVLQRLADRTLEIVQILLGNRVISRDELVGRLELDQSKLGLAHTQHGLGSKRRENLRVISEV